eukprot:CAMPEP_0202349006 /NCGR_PEP_ID=MMETSP1126-20121109/6682_1 /ASSEMBLY_ACC=CAM_ASM_000457 /TAXON_ID=3047 /ORGANISM="Dunaliella tertiolecta, Strain CCMP1320" /LENGTH=281 /DNA_ID=CAMNT_0048940753 /DNA_START=145 /DNA_END=989 /DNA_ORIENTATION=-
MYLWPELNNFIGNGCVETNLAPELNNFRGNGCVETNPAPPQGPGADCFPAEVPAQGAQVGLIGMHAGGNVSWKTCMRPARDVPDLLKPPLTPEQNQRYDLKQLESGIERLELLLPGFSINIEQLSALQWADLVTDTNGVAAKLVALKGCYPNLDLVDLLQKYPKVLTLEPQELRENAYKVMELLQGAKNPEAIIQAVPELITPKILASVIITINKWYQLERDPIEVLENDPDIVRRAQEVDTPFEPVYVNDDGSWMLPQLAYRERRSEWQKYIDQTRFKQP